MRSVLAGTGHGDGVMCMKCLPYATIRSIGDGDGERSVSPISWMTLSPNDLRDIARSYEQLACWHKRTHAEDARMILMESGSLTHVGEGVHGFGVDASGSERDRAHGVDAAGQRAALLAQEVASAFLVLGKSCRSLRRVCGAAGALVVAGRSV